MFGIIGTIGVVLQMALLSNNFDIKITLTVGIVACAAWLGHAVMIKDKSLFVTNTIVAGFAAWGLIA